MTSTFNNILSTGGLINNIINIENSFYDWFLIFDHAIHMYKLVAQFFKGYIIEFHYQEKVYIWKKTSVI